MTGREKPKRKALHRGLDDIVNRDASLTSKLLGRVKPPAREPLEVPAPGDESPAAGAHDAGAEPRAVAAEGTPSVIKLRSRGQGESAEVHKLDESRAATREPRGVENPLTTSSSAPMTFDEFVERWGFVLRSGGRAGKLRICQVFYENTYAAGRDTFFTSYEKLARLAGLEKKQCAINVKQLESLGFVERLNIYNTATKQGTEFRLHLEQLPPNARRSPRHFYYDEDLPQ
jgi:hypothetical protein